MKLGKAPYELKRNKIYGLWIRSRFVHKMTYSCYMLKLMGMNLTKENLDYHKCLEWADYERTY